jgi:hypothetical protein
MSKAIAFILGLVAGGVIFFLGSYLGLIPSPQSATERALAPRVESIPIESIAMRLVPANRSWARIT